MNPALAATIALVGAYLMGSIPFGFLFAKMKGIDLREVGSGNIGATNAARAMGLRWFFIIFTFDAAKGAVPVLLADALLAQESLDVPLIAGLGAVVGHTASVFLKFKGGKAVATGVGMIAALSPLTALACVVVFVLALLITRYVSIGSCLGAMSAPSAFWALEMQALNPFDHDARARLIMLVVLAVFVVWKHRSNLSRLMKGEEHRVSFGKAKDA